MADPMTWIAVASLAAGVGGAAYNAHQQKKIGQETKEGAKKNLQLQTEKAPETAKQDPLYASVKKYGQGQGIKENLLKNSNKQLNNVSGGVGNKTLIGQ